MAPTSVDEYIEGQEKWAADVIVELRSLLREYAPEAKESFKWAQAVFDDHGPFCFIRAFDDGVNLGFWRGSQIVDPRGLLEGKGAKMRQLRISKKEQINKKALGILIKQAVLLNKRYGST